VIGLHYQVSRYNSFTPLHFSPFAAVLARIIVEKSDWTTLNTRS